MLPGNSDQHNQTDSPVLVVRQATESDLPSITAIFNHAIQHTTASFYKEPRSLKQRRHWLFDRPDRYIVLVAESGDNNIVGWAAMDPWSEKHGYRITSEISYYVDHQSHGMGIGTRLVERLIQVARENGFKNLLAKICENNLVSLKLAERFDFECVGTLKQIGEKFDRSYDVHYYQKLL